jgi:hypothetical protein
VPTGCLDAVRLGQRRAVMVPMELGARRLAAWPYAYLLPVEPAGTAGKRPQRVLAELGALSAASPQPCMLRIPDRVILA